MRKTMKTRVKWRALPESAEKRCEARLFRWACFHDQQGQARRTQVGAIPFDVNKTSRANAKHWI
jgi:hypothetical protein